MAQEMSDDISWAFFFIWLPPHLIIPLCPTPHHPIVAHGSGHRGRVVVAAAVVSDNVARLRTFDLLTLWVPCCLGLPQTTSSHPI
jgi:hypothetical protein